MSKFTIQVISPFSDKKTKQMYECGETIVIDSANRAVDIATRGLGQIRRADCGIKKRGRRKIMIYQSWLLTVGGVETATRNLLKAFPDANFTLVINGNGSVSAKGVAELAKLCDVIIDDGEQEYECGTLILNHYTSAPEILDRVKAKKVYQMVHSDFGSLCDIGSFRQLDWKPDPRVDKVITVSETAQKGLKTRFGVDSVVVPNILLSADQNAVTTFLVASRATSEKGMDWTLDLFDRFDQADKNYRVILCTDMANAPQPIRNRIYANERIVVIDNDSHATDFLRMADYLVMLSRGESWCYSVHEALAAGVPVLASAIPEFEKVIKPGENGYIIKHVKATDIDVIFDEIPRFKPAEEKISPLWQKVLGGRL